MPYLPLGVVSHDVSRASEDALRRIERGASRVEREATSKVVQVEKEAGAFTAGGAVESLKEW